MKRLVLIMLSSPTLLGSVLSLMVMANPAKAVETSAEMAQSLQCQSSPHSQRLVCVRVSPPPTVTAAAVPTSEQGEQVAPSDDSSSTPAVLEFTEEESDAAIALFGCDCPQCLNSLRQLRGLPPIS